MKIWLGCKSADLDWLSLRHDRLFQVDNEYEDLYLFLPTFPQAR